MTEKTNYKFAEDIRGIVEELVKSDFSYIDMDEVVVVRTKKHIKGGNVLGQCTLFPDSVQFLTKKKYMLTFPPVFDTLTEKQKRITVEHELMHIPEDGKGLVPHNFEEFRAIIKKYGIDWVNTFNKAEEEIERLKEKEKLEKKLDKLKKDVDEEEKGDEKNEPN